MSFINAARANVGNPTISFDMASIASGNRFTASMFNEARSAIASSTGHGSLPGVATKGSIIVGGANGHLGKARDSINETAGLEIYE